MAKESSKFFDDAQERLSSAAGLSLASVPQELKSLSIVIEAVVNKASDYFRPLRDLRINRLKSSATGIGRSVNMKTNSLLPAIIKDKYTLNTNWKTYGLQLVHQQVSFSFKETIMQLAAAKASSYTHPPRRRNVISTSYYEGGSRNGNG